MKFVRENSKVEVIEFFSTQRQLYDIIGVSRNDLSYKDFTLNGLREPRAENHAPMNLHILNDNHTFVFMGMLCWTCCK